ncbi:MAG: hypothetical protein LBC53_09085 [Spirochaetaceae bacterium]|jgi:hypothetical protein|nr:hypothetical protein [Spirochaetaceae bacterium]
MIPKKIHYIWLGEKKYALVKQCISSWKRLMPDYEIKCWDADNIPKHHWVDEALKQKKWAFASDYLRLYALYNEGGIYLDADVYARKRFDCFLENDFFTAVEYNEKKFASTNSARLLNEDGSKKNNDAVIGGLTVNSAVIGSVKGSPVILDAMRYYNENHYIKNKLLLAPDVMALTLENYGFKYRDENQTLLNNGKIYSTDYFASGIKLFEKSGEKKKSAGGGGGIRYTFIYIHMERLFLYR